MAEVWPRAIAAGTPPKFVDVLGEMLSELDDGHVWFSKPAGAVVPPRHKEPPYNGNFNATETTLENATMIGNGFARVGTTKAHGFGVVRITRQSRADQASVQKIVEFIRSHADAPGFLVDLRGADGGNEMLAKPVASEFCAAKVLYAKSKFRNGPKSTDFGAQWMTECWKPRACRSPSQWFASLALVAFPVAKVLPRCLSACRT